MELVCEVLGTPKPEFEWYKGDVLLTSNERYSLNVNNDSYSLLISQSEEADAGIYRAVFKNEFGSSETKANANVLSKSQIIQI